MDDGRRHEWIVLAILVVGFGLVLAFLSPEPSLVSFDRRLSSERATDDGALALYLTLEGLGIPVARRTTPLADAGPVDGFTALLAPTDPLTPREVWALLDRVEEGGALLYVPSGRRDGIYDTLPIVLGTPPWDDDLDEVEAPFSWDVVPGEHRWTTPADTVRGVEVLLAGVDGARPPGNAVLSWSDSLAVLVELPWGRGRILILSDPGLLENGGIRAGGIAPVLARAVAELTETAGPLVFDDYHHGAAPGGVFTGVRGFLAGHPFGHVLIQLMVVAGLALLAAGWRFGAPEPLPVASRRSPLEHVETLAATYREAGAYRVPRLLLLAGLARHLGRPRPKDDNAVREMVARLDPTWPAVRRLSAALEGGDESLVAVATDVDDILTERRTR